jgi:hypothetical protein
MQIPELSGKNTRSYGSRKKKFIKDFEVLLMIEENDMNFGI